MNNYSDMEDGTSGHCWFCYHGMSDLAAGNCGNCRNGTLNAKKRKKKEETVIDSSKIVWTKSKVPILEGWCFWKKRAIFVHNDPWMWEPYYIEYNDGGAPSFWQGGTSVPPPVGGLWTPIIHCKDVDVNVKG